MSFDNRIDNLDKLISQLSTLRVYQPNESDLTIAALNNYSTELKTRNTDVATAEATVFNYCLSRNEILYKTGTGLVDTANGIKAYIKSVFGANSPQYHEIARYTFRKNM